MNSQLPKTSTSTPMPPVNKQKKTVMEEAEVAYWPAFSQLCEVTYYPQLGRWWPNARLIAVDGDWVVFARDGKKRPLLRRREHVQFRPLITAKERKRQEVRQSLASLIESHGALSSGVISDSIIDYLDSAYGLLDIKHGGI